MKRDFFKKQRAQRGFTLVEIAIVLVIIGIILAGILKGQEMIKQAKVKRLKADIDAIVAACYTYQDRYGYWPGDNPDGTGTGTAGCGAAGGACGNGYINNNNEASVAWQELYAANLLVGDPTQTSETVLAKKHPWGGQYLFRYGTHNGKYGMYIYVNNIPSDVASQLDQKYDDGAYNSGAVQASGDYTTAGNRDMYWYVF